MSETDNETGSRRHLLLLAYYFPPMGLSGVQRVSKMAKYLPDHGWDVTVVTVRPGGYFAYDESLLSDCRREEIQIVRTRSLDPTRLFGPKTVVVLPPEPKRRRASLLSHLIFVPDNKLGWYPFARRASLAVHRRRPVDAILSSAPPYTAHLAARSVARSLRVPFVADFRDDWVDNPRHKYPTAVHRYVHRRLESKVIRSAAATITINTNIADSLRRRSISNDIHRVIHVVPQGYDPADFWPIHHVPTPARKPMRFLYSGIFYDAQTPAPFLAGLQRAMQDIPELKESVVADFVGLVPSDFEAQIDAYGLRGLVRYHGYESHDDVVVRLASADVLWLIIGKRPGSEGISTGKLYEYFGSRRPVLGLVPAGVARNDLERYRAASIVDPDDVDAISHAITDLFRRWSAGDLPEPDPAFVEQFDRRRLAGEIAEILDHAVTEMNGQ